MFENPGSKRQHKKMKTVSAATENIGILLIQNYCGKLSLHFYHRSHTHTKKKENFDWVILLKGRVRDTLAGVQHQVKRQPGSTTCFKSRRQQDYIAGFGSSEEKIRCSCDLILPSESNRGWFWVSCDTWTSVTTVCHWSQGVFTQQWVSVAARSMGKASVHHFYFALA